MEKSLHQNPNRNRNALVAATLALMAVAGCASDGYSHDPSRVQCDSRRTITGLDENGTALFTVHGMRPDDVATIEVRRNAEGTSIKVGGDITGPPQQPLAADGFSVPIASAVGVEVNAFGAGGAWIIDVDDSTAIIQGTCDGM